MDETPLRTCLTRENVRLRAQCDEGAEICMFMNSRAALRSGYMKLSDTVDLQLRGQQRWLINQDDS